ncbi:cupin domain-containing protein [Rhizobium sp. YS-1r]|uniref:cupin domain-containing protein n=1 Tax=Rhizobium sp. YS-1r TaxID=1532558 RepID=UPI00050F4150|nr:cupin domain-containing protein [Rhizobium sp. YS-1r]KGE01960.1 transcriptional regulator [Rhizobium sp. YS-1r]
MLQNLHRLDLLIAHYVAGSFPEPVHVLVGSYLEMQAPAARFAQTLEELAGTTLRESEPLAVASRDRRLREIFASAPLPPELEPKPSHGASFPASLLAYAGIDLSGIPWKTRLPGFRRHVIERSREVEASLLWVRPGRALPRHGHRGLELTLVLEGEFHDHRGNFGRGDISIADETLDHRPVAGEQGPCICFTVLFAPIVLSGSPWRLAADILGI